jgi:DNA invertase Pin-like site-specific DNA recombinase
MKYGYARVSTVDQNANLQKDALKSSGCGKVVTEQISGATAEFSATPWPSLQERQLLDEVSPPVAG